MAIPVCQTDAARRSSIQRKFRLPSVTFFRAIVNRLHVKSALKKLSDVTEMSVDQFAHRLPYSRKIASLSPGSTQILLYTLNKSKSNDQKLVKTCLVYQPKLVTLFRYPQSAAQSRVDLRYSFIYPISTNWPAFHALAVFHLDNTDDTISAPPLFSIWLVQFNQTWTCYMMTALVFLVHHFMVLTSHSVS